MRYAFALAAACLLVSPLLAADPPQTTAPSGAAPALPPVDVQSKPLVGNLHLLPDQRELDEAPYRYTLFTGRVKDESAYGKAWFPEPLLTPEMDLEYREMQVRWFHTEKPNHYFDEAKLEAEMSFGALTVELELPYQRNFERETDEDGETETNLEQGLSRVELGFRYPFLQYVSPDAVFDYTLVGAFEVAVPTNLHFSKDFELSPRLYNLLRIGDHFSVQLSVGSETMIGPDRGGTSTLIYGAAFGYNIPHDDLPIPGVLTTIPILEVSGEHVLDGESEGPFPTAHFGSAGVRFNMESFWIAQPRIGLAYVFPLDAGAREEMHWGIIASCIFEF